MGFRIRKRTQQKGSGFGDSFLVGTNHNNNHNNNNNDNNNNNNKNNNLLAGGGSAVAQATEGGLSPTDRTITTTTPTQPQGKERVTKQFWGVSVSTKINTTTAATGRWLTAAAGGSSNNNKTNSGGGELRW